MLRGDEIILRRWLRLHRTCDGYKPRNAAHGGVIISQEVHRSSTIEAFGAAANEWVATEILFNKYTTCGRVGYYFSIPDAMMDEWASMMDEWSCYGEKRNIV